MTRAVPGVLLLFASSLWQTADTDLNRRLWHHRNLGKAFFENPTTQYRAVEEFEKALQLASDSPRERLNYALALIRAGQVDQGIEQLLAVQKAAPKIPHTWFNLGLLYKKKAQYEMALHQFQEMVELVPDEPVSRYNLGVLYRLTGDPVRALEAFQTAARLDPNLAGPHFQIYTSYRAAGRNEEAAAELKRFQELKSLHSGATVPEDLEWSPYSEILDVVDPSQFREMNPDRATPAFDLLFRSSLPGRPGGVLIVDMGGDGDPEIVAWSDREIRLLSPAGQVLESGLEGVSGARALGRGDLNNDNLQDLCVVTSEGASVRTQQSGRFVPLEDSVFPGNFKLCLWLDYDHDADPDLFLLGADQKLFRNNGGGGFAEVTPTFPFRPGVATSATELDLIKDTNGIDLLVSYEEGKSVLYRDRLLARFEPRELDLARAALHLSAGDLDNDGWTDLVSLSEEGVDLIRNEQGSLRTRQVFPAAATATLLGDLDNRGLRDIVHSGGGLANQGDFEFSPYPLAESAGFRSGAAADLDGDGRLDLVVLDRSGELKGLTNSTATSHRWIRIGLDGVRAPHQAAGAEIEVKSGLLYQKRTYQGLPVHIGLARQETIETVRITWPGGLIQNELEQAPSQEIRFQEKQRLSGSCPMVYAWNGNRFEYVAEVLGVAPLGASAGDGRFFQADHDEYLQIPAGALQERDGAYEIRITEELREVAYLDQIRLFAVDHREDSQVLTSEKFKVPPFPEFRLHELDGRVDPVAARDHKGRDVLARVLRRDSQYPDQFERDLTGVAELHFLELDFGMAAAGNEAILVLHGWVDWADGTSFLRTSQDPTRGLELPYLQVQDEAGHWRTVVADMGFPAGSPRTIVVDLSGKFLSRQRRLRIVTSLALYWDEVFLSEDRGESRQVTMREVPMETGQLHFRGFSRVSVTPDRTQPERFDYQDVRPIAMWDQTPGRYTRFGDVRSLLDRIDDQFVVMGSGDEIVLRFQASSLPAVPGGLVRDWLLFVDGWAKDGDLNTAFANSVEPLPFHAMPGYPSTESRPHDPEQDLYRSRYLTRPALRLHSRLDGTRVRGAP